MINSGSYVPPHCIFASLSTAFIRPVPHRGNIARLHQESASQCFSYTNKSLPHFQGPSGSPNEYELPAAHWNRPSNPTLQRCYTKPSNINPAIAVQILRSFFSSSYFIEKPGKLQHLYPKTSVWRSNDSETLQTHRSSKWSSHSPSSFSWVAL